MPWTETARPQYERRPARYASDMTDDEWSLVEPFMPPPNRLGRPRETDLREAMNAISYIASTGCQWGHLPKDFPPSSAVQRYFYDWRDSGLLKTINFTLVAAARERAGREASPTAGVIDSQSVKTTECDGPSGFDAGKKIKGRKRHIITDAEGNLVGLAVHPADVQDRDGALLVIEMIRSLYSWLRHLFADGAYAGEKLAGALTGLGGRSCGFRGPFQAPICACFRGRIRASRDIRYACRRGGRPRRRAPAPGAGVRKAAGQDPPYDPCPERLSGLR